MNRRLLKLMRPSLLCLLLVAGVSAPLSSVQSAPVMISNPGLATTSDVEHTIAFDPDPPSQHLPGWTYYNADDIFFIFGTYTPTINVEYINPPANQILYIETDTQNIPPATPPDAWEVGFEQALTSATLQAGTYELSVDVGNPQDSSFDYRGFGGYGIELIAGFTVNTTESDNQLEGGTVLGSAIGDGHGVTEGVIDPTTGCDPNITICEGEFAMVSLTVTPEQIDAAMIADSTLLFGAALGIRLYNRNLAIEGEVAGLFSGIGFDNVQLSFSPVPVPAAVWLFGTALLGLTGFARRQKRAAVNGSC